MPKNRFSIPLAAALLAAAAVPALATPQPVVTTPSGTKLLGTVLYEIDYATAGKSQSGAGVVNVDTVVSLGLPQKATSTQCNVQVAWYDWNGAFEGVSGPFTMTPGVTLEFTTSVNSANPAEYPPYTENVFRSVSSVFEGYGQILVDQSCGTRPALRADAEFVTLTLPPAGGPSTLAYKPINISNPKGVTGY